MLQQSLIRGLCVVPAAAQQTATVSVIDSLSYSQNIKEFSILILIAIIQLKSNLKLCFTHLDNISSWLGRFWVITHTAKAVTC